jgi:hypothetical protein
MTTRRALGVARAPLAEHRGDLYDTPSEAVHALLKAEQLPPRIWEPACGRGNIVNVLRAAGHHVIATDLVDRACPDSLSRIDFLLSGPRIHCEAIVTNPPYVLAEEFVATALERAPLVIMLLRPIESARRAPIFDGRQQLARIHVFANRLPRMHREGWAGPRASSSTAFAWFVWDRLHRGPTELHRLYWEPLRATTTAAEKNST